ncbi:MULTISPECIES: ABC transporter permease [unclassified Amycolatopsis]|uniref:ABC transporter permease n=1 Tax=unclassified Amycolatopsis TaxID=2618356 RepID=UPI001C6A0F84|nr:ABC transporter permease [Amycolatopsis sp. DSM 110486]QYN23517.1 ABC transporter permease [Amycolatopsis sp. DSM 110486]
MSRLPTTEPDAPPSTADGALPAAPHHGRNVAHYLSFKRIGAVYLLVLAIVLFTVKLGGVFFAGATVKQVVDNYSITAMAALALVVPLSAGVFDLSFAYTMSLTGVTTAYLVVHAGMGLGGAIVVAMLVALVVGLVNAFVVVVLKIDSLIGTLGTGSLIQAANTFITGDSPINDDKLTAPGYAHIAQASWAGITIPVVYAIVLAAVIWHVQEHTVTGRRLYATGFNERAARLAGVPTFRLRFLSLVAGALIAGFTGIVLGSSVGSGDPASGTPYLLPAFAAVFLGATQFKEGRFNAGGTVLAVVLLGTGDTGLALAGAATWASNTFTGIVLIAALAVTGKQRGTLRGIKRRLRRTTEPVS